MKNYQETFIITIKILVVIFVVLKYNNLKKAYKKAEQDKVYYCKEYHKLSQTNKN